MYNSDLYIANEFHVKKIRKILEEGNDAQADTQSFLCIDIFADLTRIMHGISVMRVKSPIEAAFAYQLCATKKLFNTQM